MENRDTDVDDGGAPSALPEAKRTRLEVGSTATPVGHSTRIVGASASPLGRSQASPSAKPRMVFPSADFPVGKNPLLARLDAFLPSLKRANEALPKSSEELKKIEIGITADEGDDKVADEDSEEDKKEPMIQMNIALMKMEGENEEDIEEKIMGRARTAASVPLEELRLPGQGGGEKADISVVGEK